MDDPPESVPGMMTFLLDPRGQLLGFRGVPPESGTPSAGAPDWKPRPDGCSVGLEVEDFDAAISHLKANAVKFKLEPIATPVCRMAFIHDTEGNTICIHKRKAGPGFG